VSVFRAVGDPEEHREDGFPDGTYAWIAISEWVIQEASFSISRLEVDWKSSGRTMSHIRFVIAMHLTNDGGMLLTLG